VKSDWSVSQKKKPIGEAAEEHGVGGGRDVREVRKGQGGLHRVLKVAGEQQLT